MPRVGEQGQFSACMEGQFQPWLPAGGQLQRPWDMCCSWEDVGVSRWTLCTGAPKPGRVPACRALSLGCRMAGPWGVLQALCRALLTLVPHDRALDCTGQTWEGQG